MHTSFRYRVVCVALCAALCAVLPACAGCSRSTQPPEGDRPTTVPSNGADSRAVEAMPFEVRQAALPKGFPVEIPVPDGRVVSAESQPGLGADEVWVYELRVEGSSDAVATWYRSAYANANWAVAEQDAAGDGTVSLVFGKGGAETVIRIEAAENGWSEVQASIGLGVPVSETY